MSRRRIVPVTEDADEEKPDINEETKAEEEEEGVSKEAEVEEETGEETKGGEAETKDEGEDEKIERRSKSKATIEHELEAEQVEALEAEEKAEMERRQHAENEREFRRAVLCGLPGRELSELEVKTFFPQTDQDNSLEKETYLVIRNVICNEWQRNVNSYLTINTALKAIQRAHYEQAVKIYYFLQSFGFINVGLTLHPSSSSSPFSPPPSPFSPTPNSNNKDFGGTSAIDSSHNSSSNSVQRSLGKRVIVVGAGASGLACAAQLKNFGYQVVVLEARERLGGRVHTLFSKFSGPVDVGASVVNGITGSPIGVLARQLTKIRQSKHYVPPEEEEDFVGEEDRDPEEVITSASRATLDPNIFYLWTETCPLYDSDGKLLPKTMDEHLEKLCNYLLSGTDALRQNKQKKSQEQTDIEKISISLHGLSTENKSETTASSSSTTSSTTSTTPFTLQDLNPERFSELKLESVQDVQTYHLQAGLDLVQKTLKFNLPPSLQRILDWHYANLEFACGTSLDKLSLVNWDQDDTHAFQGEHTLVTAGYGFLLHEIATTYQLDIRYNHVVTSIDYDPDKPGVTLRVNQGNSSAPTTFEGDYVVVTVPLGVLKQGGPVFQPELPVWKTEAIQRLGFGLLNKIVLEFPKVFWDENLDQFGYVVPEAKERGQFYIFWNINRALQNGYYSPTSLSQNDSNPPAGNKAILVSLMAGACAVSSEEESEKSVQNCLNILRKIFGQDKVMDPVRTHVTQWGREPFSRGSYSYIGVGASGEDYDLIGKPIGKLFFAGEATNKFYPATVPGAYLSGLRTAGHLHWESILSSLPQLISSARKRRKTASFPSESRTQEPSRKKAKEELELQDKEKQNKIELKEWAEELKRRSLVKKLQKEFQTDSTAQTKGKLDKLEILTFATLPKPKVEVFDRPEVAQQKKQVGESVAMQLLKGTVDPLKSVETPYLKELKGRGVITHPLKEQRRKATFPKILSPPTPTTTPSGPDTPMKDEKHTPGALLSPIKGEENVEDEHLRAKIQDGFESILAGKPDLEGLPEVGRFEDSPEHVEPNQDTTVVTSIVSSSASSSSTSVSSSSASSTTTTGLTSTTTTTIVAAPVLDIPTHSILTPKNETEEIGDQNDNDDSVIAQPDVQSDSSDDGDPTGGGLKPKAGPSPPPPSGNQDPFLHQKRKLFKVERSLQRKERRKKMKLSHSDHGTTGEDEKTVKKKSSSTKNKKHKKHKKAKSQPSSKKEISANNNDDWDAIVHSTTSNLVAPKVKSIFESKETEESRPEPSGGGGGGGDSDSSPVDYSLSDGEKGGSSKKKSKKDTLGITDIDAIAKSILSKKKQQKKKKRGSSDDEEGEQNVDELAKKVLEKLKADKRKRKASSKSKKSHKKKKKEA